MSSPSLEIRSCLVQAGAGAGKTYNLTHQVLDVVRAYRQKFPQRWPQVMVTTFTKKATQELSERLVRLSMEKYPELLEYVSSSGALSISTIHGVLDKFLKQQGHHIGLRSDFSYMKNTEALFSGKKVLKEIIEASPDYALLLSHFPFRKLFQVLRESAELDLQDYRPLDEKILQDLLQQELETAGMSLRSFLENQDEAAYSGKGLEVFLALKSLLPMLEKQQWPLQRDNFVSLCGDLKLTGVRVKKGEDPQPIEDLKQQVNTLKNLRSDIYDPRAFAHVSEINAVFFRLRESFVEKFEASKKKSNKIEISDLEIFALQLIRQHPLAAKEFSQEKDYWLIDEYQDTSPTQVEILRALVGDRSEYMVGDPQQSIYLFRGSRTEVFFNKRQEVLSKKGEERILDTNYRSSVSALEVINRLSEDLGAGFSPLKPSESAQEKHQGPKLAAHVQRIEGDQDPKELRDKEIHQMARHILKSHQAGVPFEDMAVLFRKNKNIEAVSEVFSSYQIPFQIHSSGLFWNRREIKDALVLLKFFVNPLDDLNLTALLRSPFLAVQEQELLSALEARKGKPVWHQVQDLLRTGTWGVTGQRLLELFDLKERIPLSVIFQRALESLGYFDTHLVLDASGRREANLWKLLHLLQQFEQERGSRYVRFLNEAEFAAEFESETDAPSAIQPQKVNMMTVHASKGLEFSSVYLPFLGDSPYRDHFLDIAVDEDKKIFAVRTGSEDSSLKSLGTLFEKQVLRQKNQRESEEDLRVFYVAYTRAKDFIYMSWAGEAQSGSWASLLSWDLSAGEHIWQNAKYSVSYEESELLNPQEALQVAPAVHIPTLYARPRFPAWEQPSAEFEESMMPVYRGAAQKKRQGILFHRLLELLRYPQRVSFQELISQWFPNSVEEVSEALQFVLNSQKTPYVDLLKKGQVEWPFVILDQGLQKQRQVDLWGVENNTLWVVDYKSGERLLLDKAFEQLDVYTKAIENHLQWTGPIRQVVIYPFLQEEHVREVR